MKILVRIAACILFSCVYSLQISGQTVPESGGSSVKPVLITGDLHPKVDAGEVISGSPNDHDEYRPGNIWVNKMAFRGLPMRYNIYRDLMQYIDKDQQLAILPDESVTKIELNGNVFVVGVQEDKPGFFLRLDSGKVTLLCKMNVAFSNGVDRHGMHEAKGPSYRRLKDTYYYRIDNGDLLKLSDIDKFIASLPDKKTELSKYVKEKKLSIKKPEDLINLVRFYNTL